MTREECNMGLGLDMASIISKQAEIREGVDKIIDDCYSRELSACSQHTIFQRQKFLNELFPYLHSKRCRIEVDRELPKCPIEMEDGLSQGVADSRLHARKQYHLTQLVMVRAGYVAVEEI